MSAIKKVRQQLSNEKEFYAQGFLSASQHLQWQKTLKSKVVDEFVALIQTDSSDEERLLGLLKKQPVLVKAILHPSVMKQIKPWYQQHPSADFKRQKRHQEALVDTLYILCARYKKQLRNTILNYSNGLIGISLEGNLQEKEKNNMLPVKAHLNLTSSQNQQLNRALKHYQAITKLQHALEGEDFPNKKLRAFITVFQQDSVQAVLCNHPLAWVTHLFQKLVTTVKFEQWLTLNTPIKDESMFCEESLLTELTQKIKKIPRYVY